MSGLYPLSLTEKAIQTISGSRQTKIKHQEERQNKNGRHMFGIKKYQEVLF